MVSSYGNSHLSNRVDPWIRTKQGSFQPPRLAISKKTAAARVGGKHASLARFAKRWRITQITTAFPLLRIREEGEGGGSASTGLAATSTGHVATEEETEVCATVAEETAAKLETRRFAGFQNFGCWDFEDRGGGGDSRHVANSGRTREGWKGEEKFPPLYGVS